MRIDEAKPPADSTVAMLFERKFATNLIAQDARSRAAVQSLHGAAIIIIGIRRSSCGAPHMAAAATLARRCSGAGEAAAAFVMIDERACDRWAHTLRRKGRAFVNAFWVRRGVEGVGCCYFLMAGAVDDVCGGV